MNENVKKVFEMLGVEPNEEFKVISKKRVSQVIHIDTRLRVLTDTSNIVVEALRCLLTGEWQIVKLPKKKKLRDLTEEDLKKWSKANCCKTVCSDCLFCNVYCDPNVAKRFWIKHKDLYSDKFLDQEVEVPE